MKTISLFLCVGALVGLAACGQESAAPPASPASKPSAVTQSDKVQEKAHAEHQGHDDHDGHDDDKAGQEHKEHGDEQAGEHKAHDDHDEHEDHDDKAGESADEHTGHDARESEGEDGHDDHAGHGDEEGEPDFAKIDPKRASELGLKIAVVAEAEIAQTLTLTGRLLVDPAKTAAVRARFAGPVISVAKNIGDTVRQGEALAVVESNESLTRYTVQSPLAGVVTARATNPGDVAGTEALFVISDVSQLLAELKLFPADQGRVAIGSAVVLETANMQVLGSVVALMPGLDELTQAQNVRVRFDSVGVAVTPGQFVSAKVDVGNGSAMLAIPLSSVQKLEGRDVVFVPEAEGFRARSIKLGTASATLVEVLSGLKAGESVVAAGSFLLKADIGKNQAAHEH
jgi:membrane fusion protein, heavy metal efflux system